jgi:hypothetical protein
MKNLSFPGLVRKSYNGIALHFSLRKTQDKIAQELLRNPIVIEYMRVAYSEGEQHILLPSNSMSFERLIEYLKR